MTCSVKIPSGQLYYGYGDLRTSSSLVVQHAAGGVCGLIINHMRDHQVWIAVPEEMQESVLQLTVWNPQPTESNHRQCRDVALKKERLCFLKDTTGLGFQSKFGYVSSLQLYAQM